MSAPALTIVPMTAGDVDAVGDIERMSYRRPWPPHLFSEELTRAWARVDVVKLRDAEPAAAGAPGAAGAIIAYCNYWLVRDEVHLLNIATHPDYRRRGVARALMVHLLAVAANNDSAMITLEVRRSNEAAQALYRRYGFIAVGVRRRYYAEENEDAIVMTLELATDAG